MAAPRNLTPEERSERASRAGLASAARLSPEERTERARKAALARTTVEARIDALVAKAPPATPEQRAKVYAWLNSGAGAA